LSREEALQWIRKRIAELRKEIEILEYIAEILESTEIESREVIIATDVSGVKILLPRSTRLDDVRVQYLIDRLNEVLGGNYRLLRDSSGRVRGIVVDREVDEKTLLYIKTILKTVME